MRVISGSVAAGILRITSLLIRMVMLSYLEGGCVAVCCTEVAAVGDL